MKRLRFSGSARPETCSAETVVPRMTNRSTPASTTDAGAALASGPAGVETATKVGPTGGEGWYYLANYKPIAAEDAERTTATQLGGQVRNYTVTSDSGGSSTMTWAVGGMCSVAEGTIGVAGDAADPSEPYLLSVAADSTQVLSKQLLATQSEPFQVDLKGAQTLSLGMQDLKRGHDEFGFAGIRVYCAHAPGQADAVG